MHRGPLERGARFLEFIIQRPGDSVYIPHLLTHAILTFDTRLTTIPSKWDATTTSNQQIIFQTLHDGTFGVHRDKWRENFRKSFRQPHKNGCFFSQQALKKVWKDDKNIENIEENIVRT